GRPRLGSWLERRRLPASLPTLLLVLDVGSHRRREEILRFPTFDFRSVHCVDDRHLPRCELIEQLGLRRFNRQPLLDEVGSKLRSTDDGAHVRDLGCGAQDGLSVVCLRRGSSCFGRSGSGLGLFLFLFFVLDSKLFLFLFFVLDSKLFLFVFLLVFRVDRLAFELGLPNVSCRSPGLGCLCLHTDKLLNFL